MFLEFKIEHSRIASWASILPNRTPIVLAAARSTGAEIARVPCQIVTLNKPARFSFAYWTTGTDGKATITEIRIVDEPVGHIIALRPSKGE